MNKLLVTGSSGLIGSEVVTYFCEQGWDVWGIDNNQRANFFGPAGDTRWNQRRLQALYKRFRHQELDVRDRNGVASCIEALRPALIVHTAAQPSHDLAASRPFDDFEVNATGTLNLLEAARRGQAGFHETTVDLELQRVPAVVVVQPRSVLRDRVVANLVVEMDEAKRGTLKETKCLNTICY